MNAYEHKGLIFGKRRVLIIEDNEINREVLKEILAENYTIYEAGDGKQGLDLLQKYYSEISIIVLDIQMPVMNGYEFLQIVKADPLLKNIPVIIATGNVSKREEEKCLNLGAADFVTKPYQANIVRSRIRNIITLRESEATISAIEYDELTGVYTRQAFCHHAGLLLKRYPEKKYSLVISDFDDFHAVNERYGEEFGNRILVHGASMIKPVMEYGIPVGRYGGDQFVSLVEYDPERRTDTFLQKMLEEMQERFPVIGLEMRIGIYDDVDHSLPITHICERALLAARSITHQFGKYTAFYDEEFRQKIERERQIEMGMKTAYDEEQFRVFYQPKHDTITGKLIGAEALIRWMHPERGFLSPAEFIPLFERTGFIYYADYFVWKRTCENLRRWKAQGIPLVPISVNTSKEDYDYPGYLDMIMQPIRKYNIDPSLLHLEVTESLFTDRLEELRKKLQYCRDVGFKIEMDDFGTGYSSLNMLGVLPLDIVKLDMSFMRELQNPKKARVFSACITLAQSLGFTTIAEGVETEEQRKLLKSLRCDAIQGYYFSKPLPEDEFADYVVRCAEQEVKTNSVLESYEPDSVMYIIDQNYRVVMVNKTAAKLYPQMKVGDLCHKCLMNLDEPCDICPIKNKIKGPQNYLDPLRGVYETVQVVQLPLPDGRDGYALVMYTLI